jgi:hypothetical protein
MLERPTVLTNALRRCCSIFALTVVFNASSSAQAKRPDECPDEPQQRLTGEVDSGGFHLKWTSEWHQSGAFKHFYREVANLGSKSFAFEWPLVGLQSPGLSPTKPSFQCFASDGFKEPPDAGTLYYGRQRHETTTHVWTRGSFKKANEESKNYERHSKGEEVPSASNASLVSIYSFHVDVPQRRRFFLFVPLPRQYEPVDIELRFTSKRTLEGEAWVVRQEVENLVDQQQLALTWESVFVSSPIEPSSDLTIDTNSGSLAPSLAPTAGQQPSQHGAGPSPPSVPDFLAAFRYLWWHIWPVRESPVDLPSPFEKGAVFSKIIRTDSKPVLRFAEISVKSSTGKTALIGAVSQWAK